MITKLLLLALTATLFIQINAQFTTNFSNPIALQTLREAFNLPDDPFQTAFNFQRAATVNNLRNQQTILTLPQISYSNLRQLAIGQNLPTKVVRRINDLKLFLIIQSNGRNVALIKIPQRAFDKLFDSRTQFLQVDKQLLRAIPEEDPLDEDARLIRLIDGDLPFLQNQGFKYPIYTQNFLNFGFSAQKVQETDEQYMLSLRNQSPLE